MEKNDIEEIYSHFLVDGMTMAPKILMIWRNKDLAGIHKDNLDIPKDLIIDYPENNKEVDFEYLLNLCKHEGSDYGVTWGEELNKKLLPYIRNEKLNKLIN